MNKMIIKAGEWSVDIVFPIILFILMTIAVYIMCIFLVILGAAIINFMGLA